MYLASEPQQYRSAAGMLSLTLRRGQETFTLDVSVPRSRSRVLLDDAIVRILNDDLRPTLKELAIPHRGAAQNRRGPNPGYEARRAALSPLCKTGGGARDASERDWRKPRQVEEMTPGHLAAELD